ncbi:MAG: SLC13 family permease, partial [Firmicutes bacterium]|nr:SLC13 family permease [Bacillota bacterium]
MNAQALAVAILGVVMILFISGRVRIDLIGLIALTAVGLLHLIPSSQLFAGFSSYAAIILTEMFILGDAMRSSGLTAHIARFLENRSRQGESHLLTWLLLLPPIPSTFVSDVGLMGILLPTMAKIRQDLHVSLHRLLMPL